MTTDTEKMVLELTRKYHPQDLGEPTSILEKAIREALLSRDTYWKERVREIIKCKRCNGQGGYLGASLGYSECEDCGGDGHCLYNREEEKLDTLLDNLK